MIRKNSSLREVAFEVCAALDRIGVKAVLTGGSAATVHAPEAYQSMDLDFVLETRPEDARPGLVLLELGYEVTGDYYVHKENPLSLDFPPGPLMVGDDRIKTWKTLRDSERVLHILSRTDSCRDRLAAFFFWRDSRGLEQALGVARSKPEEIDLEAIRSWAERERAMDRFSVFESEFRGQEPD